IGHQRARDRQHLLLATRELPRAVRTPLSKTREELHDALARPWATVSVSRYRKILVNRKRRENATSLRHQPEAQTNNAVRRPSSDIALFKEYLAPPRRSEADNGTNQCGFSHAVSAEDGYDLTPLHVERDSLEDMAIAIIGVNVADP